MTKTDVSREEIDEEERRPGDARSSSRTCPSMTYYSDTGLANGYAYVSMRGIGPTRINFTLDGVPLQRARGLGRSTSSTSATSRAPSKSSRCSGASGPRPSGVATLRRLGQLREPRPWPNEPGRRRASRLGSFGTERATRRLPARARLGDSGLKALRAGGSYQDDGRLPRQLGDRPGRASTSGLRTRARSRYFKLFGFLGPREVAARPTYAVEPEIARGGHPRSTRSRPTSRDRLRPAVRPGTVHAVR
ncbi:MAG: TonB-dependent receptor plug domain-containing protein [Comamonadaceae bacterium]|nr:TonB-dependent receptor plug domain-containing protein [Comamonadaceae bacterium]